MTEKRGTQQGDHSVFRIPPYHYIHVLDQTSNVTRIGKQTILREHSVEIS